MNGSGKSDHLEQMKLSYARAILQLLSVRTTNHSRGPFISPVYGLTA